MSRIERVNALLKKEISEIIRRRLNDSRIGFISITDVEVAKDFAFAKIFYSQWGTDEEIKQTKQGLQSAAKFIKGEIGKVLRIKTIPNLKFVYDTSLKRGVELVQKINALSKNND